MPEEGLAPSEIASDGIGGVGLGCGQATVPSITL